MKLLKLTIGMIATLALAACPEVEEELDGGVSGAGSVKNRVQWDAVPSYYNPSIEEMTFNTYDYKKISMDIFGFSDDVEVSYSRDLTQSTGHIQIYKVWSQFANWGQLSQDYGADAIQIKNQGNYSCKIQIQNGYIDSLQGGCVVRVRLILPTGVQTEVYNLGRLISKNFSTMSTVTFLTRLQSVTWPDEKMQVIGAYINSYTNSGTRPALSTEQLTVVLRSFPHGDYKLRALEFLHLYVTDRHQIEKMINNEFMLTDQSRARAIVGHGR